MDGHIPTDKDQMFAERTVLMLIYLLLLWEATYELIDRLRQEGKLKYGVKHKLFAYRDRLNEVYRRACKVFGGEDSHICDTYSRCGYAVYEGVKKAVFGDSSKKWFAVVTSASALVEFYNERLPEEFKFDAAVRIYNADKALSILGPQYQRNTAVDAIIKSVKLVNDNSQNE